MDANDLMKCRDCGTVLNEGTAKVFTVCDACWDRAYAPYKIVAGFPRETGAPEGGAPTTTEET